MRQRTQMLQAARSGKQNIVEGNLEKSLKLYIRLLGVSLGSLGELLEDYLDFARHNGVPVWDKDEPRSLRLRDAKINTVGNAGAPGLRGRNGSSGTTHSAPQPRPPPHSPPYLFSRREVADFAAHLLSQTGTPLCRAKSK